MPDPHAQTWSDFVAQFGRNVRVAREQRGLSQQRVADIAGLAEFTYRKIEQGVSNPGTPANPTLATVYSIAEALGVPAASLLPPDPGGLSSGA